MKNKNNEKINYKNYFLESEGNFKMINSIHSSEIYKGRTNNLDQSSIKSVCEYETKQKLILNYVSFKSIYFINEKKTFLIRVSNHWSELNDVWGCGSIRSCFWSLNWNKKKFKKVYKWKIGKIYFKNLKKRVIKFRIEEDAQHEQITPTKSN